VKHLEHAVRHQEATNNIDRRKGSGNGTKDDTCRLGVTSKFHHGTDHNDAANGIGNTHERSVQSRRDTPDDMVSDNDGQYEGEELLVEVGGSPEADGGEQSATHDDGEHGLEPVGALWAVDERVVAAVTVRVAVGPAVRV